jgi:crossover junction endodeoxyribonuclease RuvC
VILGIDPGATGGLALLDPDGELTAVHDMPYLDGSVSAPLVAAIIRDTDAITAAYVERAQAMPRQGIASTFKYGTGYGVLLGVLGALHIPTTTVRPTEWKRTAGLSADKGASRRRAIELWPAQAETFARVKDDGRAEAALIARHGWLAWRGEAAA